MAAASSFNDLSTEVLRDELAIQRTILVSLQDPANPPHLAVNNQIVQAQQAISNLEQALKARETKEKASSSKAAMNWNHRDSYAAASGGSTPASASTPGGSVSGLGTQRKRAFPNHFDDDDHSGLRIKSHRTTPSPLQTNITTPSAVDDFFVPDDLIDLTGDDGDFERVMKEQREAFARLQQQKEDAEMAKNLDAQFQETPSDPMPGTSRTSGPNAFDRILDRPSHLSGPSASASSEARSAVGAAPANPQPTSFTMPSSLDIDDDSSDYYDDETLDDVFGMDHFDLAISSNPTSGRWDRLTSSNLPSISLPPANPTSYPGTVHVPNVPAAELARRAALARQDGYDPYGGFGPPSSAVNLPGFGSHSAFPDLSFGQPHPTAPLGSRPGMLSSGLYDPFQSLGGFNGFHPTLQSSGSGLSDIISQSNHIDWANNRDALGRPLNDRLRSYYEDLQEDPLKTAEEIRELLANIRPDEDIPEEDRIGTPEELKCRLYAHQQLALQWMQKCEEGKNKGGILADDMGLGKTVSTLALMVSRKSSDRVKTNLIVGPVALIKQWETELKKKVKAPHTLSVFLLHGKSATYEELRRFDVVLTSYGKLSFEEKRYQKWIEQHPGADPANDAALAKICPLVHPKSKFYRIILDEAQCIKNSTTFQAKGSCRLHATYRWCLTGTPMMNGIHELYSLIRFLKIAPYHNQKEFTKTFGCLSSRSGRARSAGEFTINKAMNALRVLLRAIMLRRMKTSKLDGKPLVPLPPKTEEVAHVVFDDDERSFYSNLEARTKITFNKYLRAGTVGKNYSNVLVLLLRLRQACCHPHLNLDVEYVGNSEVTKEDMQSLAKTLSPEVVARLKAANEEGFNCPICLDAVIDPTIVLPCGHNSCGECFATLVASADENNIRAGGEGANALKCPECRGPINPKNVINLTSFKAVHMPEPVSPKEGTEESSEAEESESDDESSDSDSADDDDLEDEVDSNGNLKDFIVDDDDDEDGVAAVQNDDGVVATQSSAVASKRCQRVKTKNKRKCKGKNKGKGKEKEEIKPHMLKTLRLDAKKNKVTYKRYTKYLKKNWLPSAKVSECCRLLQTIQESGDKTIVFSQFTFLLDLLEIPVKYELGINYCRYDGGMSRVQRDAAAQDFQDPNSRTKVMLVSLKAGNAGLNLTAGNHVIIMDPFWNPYIEMQAVDRAHRIGQHKPVQIHRLLVKETVEDRIVALQEQKRKFVDAALDEGESKQLGRLSMQDLQYLFNG